MLIGLVNYTYKGVISMDQLHTVIDGHVFAKTCIHCNHTLVMSDYGVVVCEHCEEPQYLMTEEDIEYEQFQLAQRQGVGSKYDY